MSNRNPRRGRKATNSAGTAQRVITVRMPAATHSELVDLSDSLDRSINSIALESIDRFLSRFPTTREELRDEHL